MFTLNIFHKCKMKWIIDLALIPEEGLSFNGNAKITDSSLKFFIKLPTRKAKPNLYKTQIYTANLKSFSNERPDSAPKSKSIFVFVYIHKKF